MAGSDFTLEGVDELISKLDNMDDRVNRNINRIIKKSAEPVRNQGSANVNRSNVDHLHAKDDVVISNIQREGQTRDNNFVQVGYNSTGWRMWFVEFGTIYQPAQHNLLNALTAMREQVIQIQAEELRRLINASG